MNVALSCRAALQAGLALEPGAGWGCSGSGAQRQESSQEGRGLEQAAHQLALQCGMFMGVWMAAVGKGGGACPVA